MSIKHLLNFLFFFNALTVFGQSTFDTSAKWVTPPMDEDSINRPCAIFRKEFTSAEEIASARVLITCHGLYEMSINHHRVGQAYFTPGFTSYHHRLQYQEYDVSSYLHKGNNLIEITVADGWYLGAFGADLRQNRYGKKQALLFQLELTYPDGTSDSLFSDKSWMWGTGTIRHSDLYGGETIDARPRPAHWEPVDAASYRMDKLVASVSPPVSKHETFYSVRILTTPKGEKVLDFGQNLSGWVQMKVSGHVGDTIRLSHAEALDSAGNFYTGNLRSADAQDTYILSGEGTETFEPHFTYHGFRYVKVEGYPGPLRKSDFVAVALYADLQQTGSFSCSNPLLNQLQSNITWSQKSNFVDIPTDCPQRSERFGWTGDAQVFCRTASFNQDVRAFFGKWLADLAADQGSNGGLPVIIPDFRYPDSIGPRGGVAGWGDAAAIIPWTLFEVYGDTNLLRQEYPDMLAWVKYQSSQTDSDQLWKAKGYGDWYAPGKTTDINYIDQCFMIHSLEILIRTELVLGVAAGNDFSRSSVLEKYKTAFLKNYVRQDGRIANNTQTAYVLALQFDLLPDSLRSIASAYLAQLIHDNQDHLSTGFLGTPYLLHVLSRFGYTDLAFTMLNQITPPSWLYPISMGATTIWEKWQAIKPDHSFDTCSLNHYAYGAVGDWLYRVIGGINEGSPGYKKIHIHPHIGGGITWVKTSYKCPYGEIISDWKVSGKKLQMDVTIPAQTTATIYFPDGSKKDRIGPGRYRWTVSGIQKASNDAF